MGQFAPRELNLLQDIINRIDRELEYLKKLITLMETEH